MITVETASLNNLSEQEVNSLYQIIIKGYELTEEEVWGKNYVRISKADYIDLITKGQILVAKFKGSIAGGIHYYEAQPGIYTFSLLGTDFMLAGKGLGTALIQSVEDRAKKAGATAIEMEVLRVKTFDTESKLRLAKYYQKLGYHYTHSADCSCKIPAEKYSRLKAPSDFDFYRKMI
jgi:GNAT superfamily N-acetyltransferase